MMKDKERGEVQGEKQVDLASFPGSDAQEPGNETTSPGVHVGSLSLVPRLSVRIKELRLTSI